ncbi:hypothetical protein HK096_004954 [Nowakowskiella sp. JEL0078]|nr:hypothetical protein HK096_004954 [Nowakowskiella sp. JEL0078]
MRIQDVEIKPDFSSYECVSDLLIKGTISFRCGDYSKDCALALRFFGQVKSKAVEMVKIIRENEHLLVDVQSNLWVSKELAKGRHTIPFKVIIINGQLLPPSFTMNESISVIYGLSITFSRGPLAAEKRTFTIPIHLKQSSDFSLRILSAQSGFLITNRENKDSESELDSESTKNNSPKTASMSPTLSPTLSPKTVTTISSSSSSVKTKKSLFSKMSRSMSSSMVTKEDTLTYELFVKNQVIIAGYTASAELIWGWGNGIPSQQVDIPPAQKVDEINVTLFQVTRVAPQSLVSSQFEKKTILDTYKIEYNGDDRNKKSQKIIAKVPPSCPASFEHPLVSNFYLIQVKVRFDKKAKSMISFEAPLVVLDRAEAPKIKIVKHVGVPFLIRDDSLPSKNNDNHSIKTLETTSTDDESETYTVVYPYYANQPDEMTLIVGDVVQLKERFLDGYVEARILKMATKAGDKQPRTFSIGTVGIIPLHHLQETVERSEGYYSLVNFDDNSNGSLPDLSEISVDSEIPPLNLGSPTLPTLEKPSYSSSNVDDHQSRLPSGRRSLDSQRDWEERSPRQHGKSYIDTRNSLASMTISENREESYTNRNDSQTKEYETRPNSPTKRNSESPRYSPLKSGHEPNSLNLTPFTIPTPADNKRKSFVPPPLENVEAVTVDEVVNLGTLASHLGVLARFNSLRHQSIKAEALLGGGSFSIEAAENSLDGINSGIDVRSEIFLDWLFLCRAEVRYNMWLSFLVRNKPNPNRMPLPPLDVALIWHSHMLNPLRYLEDLYCMSGEPMSPYSFPLEQMHTVLGLGYEPDPVSLKVWSELTNSTLSHNHPFKLSPLDIVSSIPFRCPWCQTTTYHPPDKYVLFRIKDGGLICGNPNCAATFDSNMCSTKNFLEDVSQWIMHQTPIKGSNLNEQTCAIDPSGSIEQLSHLFLSFSTPPNEGIAQSVANLLNLAQRQNLQSCNWSVVQHYFAHSVFPALRNAGQMREVSESNFSRIMRAYRNIVHSNFSLDLVAAVLRQRKFTEKMCSGIVSWSAPGVMPRATLRYARFIMLIKQESGRFMVPTLDIDLAWHTHQLHPYRYQIFGLNNVGRVINHDDSIADDKLSKSFMVSTILWRKYFRERYASSSTTGTFVTHPSIMNSLSAPYAVYAVSRSAANMDNTSTKNRGACAFHDSTSHAVERRGFKPLMGIKTTRARSNLAECASCGPGLVACGYGKDVAGGSGCAANCGFAPGGSCISGVGNSVAPWSSCANGDEDNYDYYEE